VDDLPSSRVTLLRVYGREESKLSGVFSPCVICRYLEFIVKLGEDYLNLENILFSLTLKESVDI